MKVTMLLSFFFFFFFGGGGTCSPLRQIPTFPEALRLRLLPGIASLNHASGSLESGIQVYIEIVMVKDQSKRIWFPLHIWSMVISFPVSCCGFDDRKQGNGLGLVKFCMLQL